MIALEILYAKKEKNIDRTIKGRAIRDIWKLFKKKVFGNFLKKKRAKRKRKIRKKITGRLIQDKTIRDIRKRFEQKNDYYHLKS